MFFTQSVKLGRLNFQKRQGARKDLLETTEWANIKLQGGITSLTLKTVLWIGAESWARRPREEPQSSCGTSGNALWFFKEENAAVEVTDRKIADILFYQKFFFTILGFWIHFRDDA
jgi:hypothetical protein